MQWYKNECIFYDKICYEYLSSIYILDRVKLTQSSLF